MEAAEGGIKLMYGGRGGERGFEGEGGQREGPGALN